MDAEEISTSVFELFQFARNSPGYPFLPVIERDFGQKLFLTENPIRSFQQGHFERIPIVTGAARDGLIFLPIRTKTNFWYSICFKFV